jgi:hypothetical protein
MNAMKKFATRIPIHEPGVRTLIERYRKAGVRNISHHFYEGGRHEMLNELNRGQVRTNLLVWLSTILRDQSHGSELLWAQQTKRSQSPHA